MITAKDVEIIRESVGMLDCLNFTPGKYSIPMLELADRLAEVGMLENYKKWDVYLQKQGFKFSYPTAANIRIGALIYEYTTDLSVTGEHAYDCVVIYAYVTAEKVLFAYDSSNLNYYDPSYPIDIEARVKKFCDKNSDYINFYPPMQKIEPVLIDADYYFIAEAAEERIFRMDDFARLAITLDREMNKRYPFNNLREYEIKETEFLARTLTEEPFFHPGFLTYSDECFLKTLIGTSFHEKREDSLERAKEILYSLTESNKNLVEYVVSAVCELETMSDTEYSDMKDKIFDI